MKVALLAGGTGLIGSQLLQLLIMDEAYSTIKCLTRNELPISNSKIEVIHTNGDNLAELASSLTADDVFCCLGTTIKKAKSKEAFRKIDFDYPLNLAKVSKAGGAKQFLLISALGADPSSSVFYNKVKGEVEEAIAEVGFEGYHIFRPSLLLGERAEERSGEDAAKIFFKLFGFLVPGKYKAIDSSKVARAMVAKAKLSEMGTSVSESKVLQSF
ncbi:MAG: oxidoreductase [Cyclobacteriaceae bacterium]|nr:oxidoreductase [Cyclobacteriaceae bacterium]